MAELNIIDLNQTFFSHKGVAFNDIEVPNSPSAELASILGTPIVMPLTLDGVRLPNEPLISITGKKRIITTPIDGHNGSFKEFFANDDYRIVIRGIAVNEEEEEYYPEKIVRELRKLAEKPSALKVANKLLSYFNINQLVIEEYDFPAVEGGMGLQPYTFTCLSDESFELELKNP